MEFLLLNNEERILEINPETILIGGWCENTRKERLLADTKWADVSAVKNNSFLGINWFCLF